METAVLALVLVAIWYAWRRHAYAMALKDEAAKNEAATARAAYEALATPRIDLSE